MTHTWTIVPKPASGTTPGGELVTNGGFVGGTTGWTFNDPNNRWAYGSNDVVHTPGVGDGGQLEQNVAVIPGATYQVSVTVGGTTGSITMQLGDSFFNVNAGDGTVTMNLSPVDNVQPTVVFAASSDFDGTVTGVSVRPLSLWANIPAPSAPSWTPVTKAVGTSYTVIPAPIGTVTTFYGAAYGLLLAITQPHAITTDKWTRIGYPTSNWTHIPKAT